MRLHIIHTGYFKLDGGAMFGVVPKSIWQRINPPDEKNLCTWSMRCLLVEMDKRLILIDTGLGDKQGEKFFSHYEPQGDGVVAAVKKAGFSPQDVTDVLLTHLHFDHCGGAVAKDLTPAFKNATYWSNETHWNWAMNPNARERASFLKENFVPLQEAGQLRFAEDGQEILPGIIVRFVYGHTEAMMIPYISYKGKTIVYMADLLPSAGHIPLPYVMAYDVRPLLTLEEKAAFLKEAAEKNYMLFFEHDRENECATVKQGERYVALDKVFALKDAP